MIDEQIIKALECCSIKHCSKCPSYDEDFGCDENTIKAAIDLINRQKAEIEELRSDKIIAERHEKDARELFVDCTRQLEEAKAEIKRLKERISYLEESIDCSRKKYNRSLQKMQQLKSEAIKEFVERLCKGRVENDPVVIAAKAELDYMLGVGLEAENSENC